SFLSTVSPGEMRGKTSVAPRCIGAVRPEGKPQSSGIGACLWTWEREAKEEPRTSKADVRATFATLVWEREAKEEPPPCIRALPLFQEDLKGIGEISSLLRGKLNL